MLFGTMTPPPDNDDNKSLRGPRESWLDMVTGAFNRLMGAEKPAPIRPGRQPAKGSGPRR